ncbi:MAG: hypothetical protein ACRDHW_00435 [Ktedonobacteraceae bacterium]
MNWIKGSAFPAAPATTYVALFTTLQLGRGTNSTGGGAFTSISTVTISLSIGSTHRLKAVISGNSHSISIDGVQLIRASDSSFP